MYPQATTFPSLAPQALAQPILPGWIFANNVSVTEENSSSPETEQKILVKHSYGRQLGRVIDVLGELIEKWPGGPLDDPSVQRFEELKNDIDEIKAKRIEAAISDLAAMKKRNPGEYNRLAPKIREILESGPDLRASRGSDHVAAPPPEAGTT